MVLVSRLAKRRSILILTRPVVKTNLYRTLLVDWWLVGGWLGWLNHRHTNVYISVCPLDIIVNVVQLLLQGFYLAFSVHLCEYSHRNLATVHVAHVPCHLQKWYTKSKFYVRSFCDKNSYHFHNLILVNQDKATHVNRSCIWSTLHQMLIF